MGFWTLKTENCPTLHTANDWNVYEPVTGKWFDQENVQIRKVFISFFRQNKIFQDLFDKDVVKIRMSFEDMNVC